ncbi:MAG TPA: DinB family protein [Caldilineaceae bacterium]|nr:DinB family protein [Caldilineaceae bacterium]
MDLLDRLLGHDAWTTRQLLLACQPLPAELLDREFAVDQRSLRKTFVHLIANMEVWTDLMGERPVQGREGDSIPELLDRLSVVSREFAHIARQIARQGRYDDCFVDTLDNPPRRKTFGGAIGHLITHNMHHRAQIMFLMESVGLQEHIEGDLMSWESLAFGWG